MKKAKVSDELRPEYRREDLGQGIRGKYFESYRKGSNLVLLSPDVAKVFPTEEAVNEVLRSLIDLAQKSTHSTPRSEARGMLRVDTERRFLPRFKNRGLAPSNVSTGRTKR